jgi:hypothetical protein
VPLKPREMDQEESVILPTIQTLEHFGMAPTN